MDWLQNIDWFSLLKCFITGGLICVIGQILIDKTKLTSARILVLFVTTGTILGGLGIYQYLVDFAGAGATGASGITGVSTGGAILIGTGFSITGAEFTTLGASLTGFTTGSSITGSGVGACGTEFL